MNFYQAVFHENIFLENIYKESRFWCTYPLILTLSGQSYDYKNIILISRQYMPQHCRVSKKSKTF